MGLFSLKDCEDCPLPQRLDDALARIEKLERDHEALRRNRDGYKGSWRQIEVFAERCKKAGCAFWQNVVVDKGQQED